MVDLSIVLVNTLDILNRAHSKKYPMKLWRKKIFHLYDQSSVYYYEYKITKF